MDDREILDCIAGLVAEEHWLRQQRDLGMLTEDAEHARLDQVERSLDDLWSTLRQRRALRAAGLSPDALPDMEALRDEADSDDDDVVDDGPLDAAPTPGGPTRLADVVPLHAAAGRARLG